MNRLSDFWSSVWLALNFPILTLGKVSITLWAILLNITLIIALLIASSRVKGWLMNLLARGKGLNVSNWRAVITLGYYALLGIGLIGILQATGLDLGLFSVLAGTIGIGVGFGMQAIFSNFISGIIILLEKPLTVGDRVEVGNVSGSVQSISVRATTIITNDNVAVIVPNSDFVSKQLINWSSSGSTVRISVEVNVSYDADPEQVERLLLEIAGLESGVLESPPPLVCLNEFGESGLLFKLLVWTEEYMEKPDFLRSRLNFSILKCFREKNICIPFPRRDVHVFNAPGVTSVIGADAADLV